MKILFLLAPSEWKNEWWNLKKERLSFSFEKPLDISKNVSEKDLKCKWERFEEGVILNKNILNSETTYAINRYSWVVFNAIDYSWMSDAWKDFFINNVLIVSGMYGLVKPLDVIWNYKLPIETKWLYSFWWDKILDKLNELNYDYIVNLLPNSYLKMINPKKINSKIININFLTEKDWKIVKMSHWVKKYRGEFLNNICENNLIDYKNYWWEVIENEKNIDINILK